MAAREFFPFLFNIIGLSNFEFPKNRKNAKKTFLEFREGMFWGGARVESKFPIASILWIQSKLIFNGPRAQLVKFSINDSFWSNFEPVEISQKFNFLQTDYDYRTFLKASGKHRGMNHSNAIFKKLLTAKSVSIH